MAQAERTAGKARLADRLINGLAGEFQRWTATIKQFTLAEGARARPPRQPQASPAGRRATRGARAGRQAGRQHAAGGRVRELRRAL